MSGQQQQTIYTIHESQLNNGQFQQQQQNGDDQQQQQQHRNSNSELLIDTSSIPMTHQTPMPPMQHQHLQPTPAGGQQQLAAGDTITSQPPASTSARVAPEGQNIVYSVHPIFSLLDRHDALLVRQRADCTSTCCGFESANTYTVRARDGSPILKAIENSNCCERCCFETNREYNLSLVYGDEIVARIRKPYRVSRFCCYSNAVQIESPEDNPIGYISQLFTFFGHPRYAIYDCQQPPKTPSFLLESTSCRFCCTPFLCTCICGNREFRIVSTESRDEVGTITRHWSRDRSGGGGGGEPASGRLEMSGENQESEPNDGGDSNPFEGNSGGCQLFGVQFSTDLEARQKVLLLSACFMMDFFYFENDRRRRKLASC